MKDLKLLIISLFVMILLCILMLVFSICNLFNKETIVEEVINYSQQKYRVYDVGYSNDNSEVIVIKTYNDLITVANKYINYIYDNDGNVVGSTIDSFVTNYNSNYFNDSNLIYIYVPTMRITNVYSYKKDNTLYIKYDETGEGNNKTGEAIVISVDKDIDSVIID